ncbi:MAG: penicillin-binding protein activator, partial [Alphaproteobacteria bacterium]|nr:penicillin-binding protein activator [Alphaproteobacteria bacterium]
VALSSILAGRDFAPDFSARRLQYTKGYQGVRGLFRLSRFGYAERLLAIKQIRQRQVVIIAPSADSFDGALTN